jgi:hypothetical protein
MQLKQLARMWVGSRANMPVEVVDGKIAPREVGSGYYFTTPSGKTIVRYPNAYGWRTLYHPSTLRIEVGRDWKSNVREVVVDRLPTWIRGNFRDFDGLRIARGWISAGRDGWKRVWAIRDPKIGRGYHGQRWNNAQLWDGLEEAICDARKAWILRAQQEIENTVIESLGDIAEALITREASIEAGNCAVGTDAFIARHGWNNRYYVRARVLDRTGESRAYQAIAVARRALARIIMQQEQANGQFIRTQS